MPSGRAIQTALFLSRWLLAPFLVGLFCSLLLLIYRFIADFYSIAIRLPSLGWHELVVEVLNLVDVSLTANLVLIVVFSGYENFISKVKPNEHPDWPEGLVEINFSALKQKVLGSIVIITSVDALAWYLDLEKEANSAKLGWVIGFPLMFVIVLVMLAVADRLGRHSSNKTE
ncbi:MAG TPA: YqhA family protein [Xanthobacteraceae bacterium]|jgi:uncharacterized protein (TIGR00645 family)|nr:YqhA family protein [Xanthobacteraceae bacterium]